MTWATQLARVRRYLRDPSGNIWSDALLLNLYNDEQAHIASKVPIDENVAVIRIPQKFASGYMHDFEYTHSGQVTGSPKEYLSNGNFASATGWTLGTGWSIAGGKASCNGSQSALSELYCSPVKAFAIGETYRVTYTISDYSAGTVLPYIIGGVAGEQQGAVRTANGKYTDDLTASQDRFDLYTQLRFQANKTFKGSIKDVSLQLVSRYPYKFGYYDDKNDYVFLHKWETQHFENLTTASTSSEGHTYTHPWEAFVSGVTPSEPPPFPLPTNFHSVKDLYWDRKPLEPTTLKEIQERDTSWRTHGGYPTHYYRHDKLEDWIYLWPRPSIGSDNWQDDYAGEGYSDEAEYGGNTDVDNNLLVIFKKETEDFDATTDVSALPSFLTKYIEYGVISRAYRANTDGRIESLAEYWEWRKEIGLKILATYKSKRYSARHYQLRTPGIPGRLTYRHPRLPDTEITTS